MHQIIYQIGKILKVCVGGKGRIFEWTKKLGNSGTKGRTMGTRHTQKACNSNDRRVLAVFFPLDEKNLATQKKTVNLESDKKDFRGSITLASYLEIFFLLPR